MSICFFEFLEIKSFRYVWDLWYVNLESKNCKPLSTHSLISLSFKFWYQLLTIAFCILRKLNIFNKHFMWKQKIMVKTKIETTLTLESLGFIHYMLDLIRLKWYEAWLCTIYLVGHYFKLLSSNTCISHPKWEFKS